MTKESRLFSILILVFMQSCIATDTTSPQTSKSINSAKNNGTFVKEFYVEKKHFDSLSVESAWIEKIWYNENNGKRTITDNCKLCFKIKQVPGGNFLFRNTLDWSIKEVNSNRYVGVEIYKSISGEEGIYIYELQNCATPDSIVFNLYIKSNEEEIIVGNLVFKNKKSGS